MFEIARRGIATLTVVVRVRGKAPSKAIYRKCGSLQRRTATSPRMSEGSEMMITDHVEAAQTVLRSSVRLTGWESRFCSEMTRVRSPTEKAIGGCLMLLVARVKEPRRARRRRRASR
jgi:hypothetical protein